MLKSNSTAPAGEGRARWSFPSQISMIYNTAWMTRKKWDAIWKLLYKIESIPNKDTQQDGDIEKEIKMDSECEQKIRQLETEIEKSKLFLDHSFWAGKVPESTAV